MTVATRPRVRNGLTVVEIDEEAVVYDAETKQLHRLNPTGHLIFSLCDGSTTAAELTADIAELYGLPCEDVETHVVTMLSGLEAAGLLEHRSARGPGGAASTVEQPPPPAVEPPARHLHTKRPGNP